MDSLRKSSSIYGCLFYPRLPERGALKLLPSQLHTATEELRCLLEVPRNEAGFFVVIFRMPMRSERQICTADAKRISDISRLRLM